MVTPKGSVHKLTQKLKPPYSVKKKTVNKQYHRKVLLSKFYVGLSSTDKIRTTLYNVVNGITVKLTKIVRGCLPFSFLVYYLSLRL